MTKRPRFMLTVTPAQLAWLQAEAERLGLSVAELVRRIIDRVRGAGPS